ncbi:abhydrolase domain-containing protein 11 [Trypanosoma rangeli]|uniref:Abhydrolase domain-containing protein 11 n=1 Tax=Trypanosoma rangeli TaxID=5698 RepID=A0A3R7LZE9_TRYRA|nr:abhydrolase domain-containing protein 11 [Trypanosoma rangeli]RNF06269.1 abhydrolase domain-containing protein 11 [Trypanosoma rangeli]|eukprot:RNF06269.1 abhydrolase domain-containing protein 11 [Trypanosoma rangeli]
MKKLAYKTVRGGAWGKTSSRIIISHGFLGSSSNWATVSRRLVEHKLLRSKLHEISLLDMRNHGDSPHASPHTNAVLASDLEVFAMQQQEGRPPCDDGGIVLIGHSMGGLATMAALLRRANELSLLLPSSEELQTRLVRGDYYGWKDEQGFAQEMSSVNESMGFPAHQPLDMFFGCSKTTSAVLPRYSPGQQQRGLRVKAAVIVDITPTARLGSTAKNSQCVALTLDAIARADLSRISSYADGDTELERCGISDKAMRSFVLTNLVLDHKTGKRKWRCNLPVLCADYGRMGLGLLDWYLNAPAEGNSSDDRMVAPTRCALPTLFVFGAQSPYNSTEDRRFIDRFFSNVTQSEVMGAGHFVHYEKMQEFVDTVAPFLAKHL